MKKFKFGTWSDDCSYIDQDGETISKSDYSIKVLTVNGVKIRFEYSYGDVDFSVEVDDDAAVALEEFEVDEDEEEE